MAADAARSGFPRGAGRGTPGHRSLPRRPRSRPHTAGAGLARRGRGPRPAGRPRTQAPTAAQAARSRAPRGHHPAAARCGRGPARPSSRCCSSARRARGRPASPGTGRTTGRVPTAHISLDDVREWVCSGFADPQAGWNDHSEAQYRLARRTCGFAARNYLANGISCILDDAVFPDRPVVGLGGWKRHVGPGPAAGRPPARPGDRPGAQRRTLRQPPAHRRGGRPHPRPDGRLVRLGPADHRQLPARRRRPRPESWTTSWPAPSPSPPKW